MAWLRKICLLVDSLTNGMLSVLSAPSTLLISHREPRENIDGDSLIQQFRAEVEAAGQSTKPRVVILPEGCKCWDELSGDLKEEYRVAENESEGDTDGDSQSEDED
jgi:hypothetical protein